MSTANKEFTSDVTVGTVLFDWPAQWLDLKRLVQGSAW